MRYLKCKCGASERWDSGEAVHECQGCPKCNTTFSTHPDGHKPLGEHDWAPRFNPATGQPDKRMCNRCYALERAPEGGGTS